MMFTCGARQAKLVPGKEEFHETLRYFEHRLAEAGVDVRLNTHISGAEDLQAAMPDGRAPDAVVLATGVVPRPLQIEGHDHPKVVSYGQCWWPFFVLGIKQN